MHKWLEQWFSAEEARSGGVIRRQKADVHKYASLPLLKAEVEKRRWHLIELTDQYVVICDPSPMSIIVQ